MNRPDHVTENELLQSIQRDPEAFSGLFRLYYKPVFGYILRRTGDIDTSADIAADTFFKALSHIHRFSYRGVSLKVWLYRIATNEVNQYFRHRKKRDALFERIDPENQHLFRQAFQEDRQALERELEQHEQFHAVLEALKTLPIRYQEVISLRYFEGKDNKEIALILNIREGTLKSLLSRGLEKLRRKCNPF